MDLNEIKLVPYNKPLLPQKCAKIPPKIAQRKTGAGVGDVTVSYCDVIPRLPSRDPQGESSLSPLYYLSHGGV